MIILHCSTMRACGRGHREKQFEMIIASDRWMTSLALALSLPMNLYHTSICMHMCACALHECVCVLYKHLCVFAYSVCLLGHVSGHVIWPLGKCRSPAEFLTQSHHKSRKDLHQTDYSTAAMTASNGRNKTPFNEDANLRNITLCSET